MSKKVRFQAQIVRIALFSTSFPRLLKKIIERVKKNKKTFVITPNPEFIVYAQRNPWFTKVLAQADFAVPDGTGLVWASRFLAFRPLGTLFSLMRNLPPTALRASGLTSRFAQKGPSRPSAIKERISGTDLMEGLCQEAARRGWSVYLLGGPPGVAAAAAAKLKIKNEKLKIWADSGPKLEIRNSKLIGKSKLAFRRNLAQRAIRNLVKRINSKHPDFLFVAFGMGKQEKFIWDNWPKLKVKLAMGVGGAFDYLSGRVPRAPIWVQKAGFEWLFRLAHEPWRLKRQLALLEFLWLVLKEKFSGK